jgi:hypothetical protein
MARPLIVMARPLIVMVRPLYVMVRPLYVMVRPLYVMVRPLYVMVRLDRAIGINIVLQQMAGSSPAMTKKGSYPGNSSTFFARILR